MAPSLGVGVGGSFCLPILHSLHIPQGICCKIKISQLAKDVPHFYKWGWYI